MGVNLEQRNALNKINQIVYLQKIKFHVMKRLFFGSLLLIVCISCRKDNTNEEDKLIEFVKFWNEAHSEKKLTALNSCYSNAVDYYGHKFSRNEVLKHKTLLFEKFPDYAQIIQYEDIITNKTDGKYSVEFVKSVNYADTVERYKTTLNVYKKNRKFRIASENVDEKPKLKSPIFPSNREIVTIIKDEKELFGDFNGDGISGHANVISPELLSTIDDQSDREVRCQTECRSVIIFSEPNLKEINIKGAYKSKLENLKDINGDGADEIGFWDIKPTTKTLYVYSAINGKLLCEPARINTIVHKNLDFIDVFKKTGPNKVNLTYSEQVNGKWVLKSKEYTVEPVFIARDE